MNIPILLPELLPGYVLNREPLILCAYDNDLLKAAGAFRRALPRKPAWWFLQFGWQHETDALADSFAAALHAVREKTPWWNFVVLTNTPAEAEQMRQRGVEACFCHQNAFLDPERYPLADVPRRYDAIYVARITPFKRHALAAKIASLRLIGDYSMREKPYFEEIMRLLPQADWSRRCRSRRISRAMAGAHCGLALSAEEGAMFVSAEYLLAGIPVVDTASLGGRDRLLPEFAVRKVADTPEAVAEAVAFWREYGPEPRALREGFLALAAPHRQVLRDLIAEKTGVMLEKFPHKLGLRCRLLPWQRWIHGVRA